MLGFFIFLGVLWIILKLLTFVVEIPFQFMQFVLSVPFGIAFWIIILILLFTMRR